MKKVLFGLCLTFLGTVSVFAIKSNFKVDIKKIFKENRTNDVVNNFSYKINYKEEENGDKQLIDLSRKITYLMLGDGDNSDESATNYLERKTDYMSYMYNPSIPKDNEGNLDSNSQEYKDSVVSGLVVPGMFKLLNEANVRYSTLGNISTSKIDGGYLSRVVIENVTMDTTDESNPRKYKTITTNLIMYYIFKEYKGELKLYYSMGETEDELADYLKQAKENENKGITDLKLPNKSSLASLYDYSKLNSLTNNDLTNIYNSNINKIMLLNTYYNNSIINNGTGFMITSDVLVTSWSYLKDSLVKGQYITVKDYKGNNYTLDGVITINEDADIALLKISGYKGNGVILGDSNSIKVEDAVIVLGTKTGMGVSADSGIVVNNSGKIESLIPLTSSDQGSPLINSKGEVIGINTNKSINSSISYANKINSLKDLQKKFNDNKDIKYTSFDKLKENYYYNHNNDEKITNTLSKKEWNKYKKVGKLDEIVFLPLVKASKKDNVLSLRYRNDVPNFISNDSLVNSFTKELKNEGYKETLNSNKKIYEKNGNEVIVMTEFNYLIIVMVIK